MCAHMCARVCTRERCPQPGTGRAGRVVSVRARGVRAGAGAGGAFAGGRGELEPLAPGSGWGTAGSVVQHGTAQHGTARHGTAWRGCVCSCTPPMSAPACSPAPRQASSRCSGQSEPAPGQLSMLGGRLFPLPKSGRSFPQDRVSQQYGDNGKMLRQHSWQPSARCSVSAAAAQRSIVLKGREIPTSGRRQSQACSVGREQEQDGLQKGDQNTARMGHR